MKPIAFFLLLCGLSMVLLAAERDPSRPPGLKLEKVCLEPAPPPATNLVPNYSFEQVRPTDGPAMDWVWERRNTDATAALDEQVAHSGQRSLRFTNGTPFGAHVYGLLRSTRPVPLKPGATYSLSCLVKSDDPGIAWIGGGQNWRVRLHFAPTGGAWQRFSTTFTPNAEERDFVLLVSTENPTSGFWLDDLKLEEGSAPTFCVPALPPPRPLLSPPVAQELSDGPWSCRFEVYTRGYAQSPLALRLRDLRPDPPAESVPAEPHRSTRTLAP